MTPSDWLLAHEAEVRLGAGLLHGMPRLPAGFERPLRWLLVTPEMHHIHHSSFRIETDSNFGFHLSVWDRLFGSYRDQPRDGHTGMVIGLHNFRDTGQQTLSALLLNPFRSTTAPTSIGDTK